MPNFVLPYDAERGMIPLMKYHLLVEAPLSFYSSALAGRYDFQDGTLVSVIKVYLLRGWCWNFRKSRLVKSPEGLCNPQISM